MPLLVTSLKSNITAKYTVVGSSSENMFSPWIQSWLRLPLSSSNFKGTTPRKQFCVSAAVVRRPFISSYLRSSSLTAVLWHPLFNQHRSCTSLTSSSFFTVFRDSLITFPWPHPHPPRYQHAIIRHIYSNAGMEHG